MALHDYTPDVIYQAVEQYGDKGLAAEALGVKRYTLVTWIRRHRPPERNYAGAITCRHNCDRCKLVCAPTCLRYGKDIAPADWLPNAGPCAGCPCLAEERRTMVTLYQRPGDVDNVAMPPQIGWARGRKLA